MAEIMLPFREDMRRAILDGRKVCTSRRTRHGAVGDTFNLGTPEEPRIYFIAAIVKLPLDFVAITLFREEGTNSMREFIALWEEIYPEGYDPNALVFVHFFEAVQERDG